MTSAAKSELTAILHGANLSLQDIQTSSIADAIASRIALIPNGVFQTFVSRTEHRKQSYQETWRRAAGLAAHMRSRGIQPGHLVVILIDDVIDFVTAFWACLRGGFVAVPLVSMGQEALQTRRNSALGVALNSLGGATMLADEAHAQLATDMGRELDLRILHYKDVVQQPWGPGIDIQPENSTCLIPTSGSTGFSKFAVLSGSTLVNRFFGGAFGLKEQDHHLGTFPLDSISGVRAAFPRFGSWTQISPSLLRTNPAVVLDAIERMQISVASVAASTVSLLSTSAQSPNSEWNLRSLKQMSVGGEALPVLTAQKLVNALKRHDGAPDIRVGYGTTETGILVEGASIGGHSDILQPFALGGPAPGVSLRVRNESGELLSEGEIGELEVQCPQTIFSSYWGDADTRGAFTEDGWFRTGDTGKLRAGSLSIHGRTKDIVIVQGRKLALAEIDAELRRALPSDCQAYACSIGRKTDMSETLAIAYVTLPGSEDDRAKSQQIRSIIVKRLGVIPGAIVHVRREEIPLTATSKIRRAELALTIESKVANIGKPKQQSQKTIEEIWRQILEVNGEVDYEADFFELGGDSLRAVTLHAAVEESFQRSFAPDVFFANPTLANLVKMIEGDERVIQASSSARQMWPLPTSFRDRLLAPLEIWPGSRPTKDRLLLSLNTAGDKPPIFWVFNEQHEFSSLASMLGPSQPVYAFRSPMGVSDYSEDEIQMLALRYITEINEAYPRGPLFIGGGCQGAIIALAVAQHALRRKRHVPLLVLLDWSFEAQAYAGPVLLVSGAENLKQNQMLKYLRPDLGWRKAFSDFSFAEIPGGYAEPFREPALSALSDVLRKHLRDALQAAPGLLPDEARSASIAIGKAPTEVSVGQCFEIEIQLSNESALLWESTDKSGLMLGVRWIGPNGDVYPSIGERVELPKMPSRTGISCKMAITAPSEPGDFRLCIDVSEEGSRWFHKDPQAAPFVPVSVARSEPISSSGSRPFWFGRPFAGRSIRFKAGDPVSRYLVSGWSTPERWGTWSIGKTATLTVPIREGATISRVRLECCAFGPKGAIVPVQVGIGYRRLVQWDLPANSVVRREINVGVSDADLQLRFAFPNAVSPADLGLSDDPRQLGLGIIKLCIN